MILAALKLLNKCTKMVTYRYNVLSVSTVCVLFSSKSNMLRTIVGILYFVSATVNPILYNVMSLRYRKAFRDTLHAALVAAHCQRPDIPALVLPAGQHSCPLIRRHLSDGNVETANRRKRSEDCITGWLTPHSQIRHTGGIQQTVTLTVGHTLSDEEPETCHH